MSWHYGLKKDKDGWLELCEIYSEGSYTSTPIRIAGETLEEIQDIIAMMYEDLKEPHIIEVQDND